MIAENEELLDSIIILIDNDNTGVAKQKLMRELKRSQTPVEKILAKFEGMLIVSEKMEGVSYCYKLNANGQNLVRNLINKNYLIVNERGVSKNVNG